MEVEDLFQFAKVRAEGSEFSQVKHRACKEDPGKQGEQCLLSVSMLARVTPSPSPPRPKKNITPIGTHQWLSLNTM